MMIFIVFFFRPEIRHLGQFGLEIQNCWFKLNVDNLDYFECVKFDGHVHFFVLDLFSYFFSIWQFTRKNLKPVALFVSIKR